MTVPPAVDHSNTYFSSTLDEANALAAATVGPNVQINPNTPSPVKCWIPLDKINMRDFLNLASSWVNLPNNSFYEVFIAGGAGFFPVAGIQETPRRGWTDSNGIVKKPPPSEKPGKNTQIGNVALPDAILSTIQVLQSLAAELLKSADSNRRRVGGIIIYQLGLALTGAKSITDALVFLEPYLDSL